MNNLKKNLIIISVDNLRADCVACNSKVEALTLNRFAEEGVFFNNCIATAPYTTNAHASMLTGFWPYNHGVIDFFGAKLAKPTIFKILQEYGYKTLWQTDFSFLLGDKLGFSEGVDKFVAGVEQESFDWIKNNKNENWAAFFHFANVHDPYGFVDLAHSGKDYYDKVDFLLEKYNLKKEEVAYPGQHYTLSNEMSEADMLLKQNYRQVLAFLHEQKKYDEIMDLYLEGLSYFDKNRFTDFINNLEELSALNNSLVVIVGDHGELWDADNQGHNKGNGKNALSEALVRVPFIIWQKEFRGNVKIEKQIRSIDIVPTILSLLEIDQKKFDGVDLSDYFSISDSLPAYSQLWETDSALVTIFMNQVKAMDKFETPEFSSRLTGSALRQADFSLLDYYPKTGKAQSKFLKDNTPVKNPEDYDDELEVLRRRLDEYNEKTVNKYNEKNRKIKGDDRDEIAKQLRAIGYNV